MKTTILLVVLGAVAQGCGGGEFSAGPGAEENDAGDAGGVKDAGVTWDVVREASALEAAAPDAASGADGAGDACVESLSCGPLQCGVVALKCGPGGYNCGDCPAGLSCSHGACACPAGLHFCQNGTCASVPC